LPRRQRIVPAGWAEEYRNRVATTCWQAIARSLARSRSSRHRRCGHGRS